LDQKAGPEEEEKEAMKGHVRFYKGAWRPVIYEGREINSKGKLTDKYRWLGGFPTEREADEELSRQLAAKAEGSYVRPSAMTVRQYLDHWLTVKKTGASPKTYQEYEGKVRLYVTPAIGGVRLGKLTALDVEALYAHLLKKGHQGGKKGLSEQTVLHVHRLLHKAFEDAVKKKLVSYNVIHAAQPPAVPHREMEAPDEDTMTLLMFKAKKAGYLWLPVVMASGSGMRRGEILAARWSDFNAATGAIRVTRSLCQTREGLVFKDAKKKKSRRVVELPQFVLDALAEVREEQRENRTKHGSEYQELDLICAMPNGSPIPPDKLSKTFSLLKRRLLLKARFHDLRHGHASQALQDGTPVKTVQSRLGHATAAFTLDVYGHLMPGDDKRAADAAQRRIAAAMERARKQEAIN
jgi:integrase